jgi:hypothetical protein
MRPQTATENSITAQWHPDLLGRLCDLVFRQRKADEEPREYAGVLQGTVQRDGGSAQIIVRLFTPISLSLADRADLQQSIASYASPYWSCVGFYRSHCRLGLEPDAEDLQLAREYLRDQPGVFLLLGANAPHSSLFLFDGLRFSRDPAFVLPGFPSVSGSQPNPSASLHAPTAGDDDKLETSESAALAGEFWEFVKHELTRTWAMLFGFAAGLRKKRIPGWLVCTLILLVIGLVVWIRADRHVPTSNRQVKSSAPAMRGLGLTSSVELDHIHIAWNPHAPAIARASSGTLAVTDGTARHTIPLDASVLAHGSVAYYPTSDLATFELRIGDITESLVAMGLARTMNVRPSLKEPADALESKPESARKSSVPQAETRSSQPITKAPPQVVQRKSPAPARNSGSERVPPKRQALRNVQPRSEPKAARPAKQPDLASAQPIKRVFPKASGDSLKLLVGSVTIHVQVHIDSEGRVVQAAPLSHGGSMIESLSDLSVNAAREWVFSPARKKGRDVESNTVLEFVFDNQGIEKPADN